MREQKAGQAEKRSWDPRYFFKKGFLSPEA